ncbi:MAG: NAD(P)/FAD-dependent oxidoreductase, partial [archaeon]|nr:NAD(P)/FAD-dependent oxidoreductase [archaeon]
LSSAIFSARRGKKVIIIEKGNKVGPEPRGETLHDSPILAELLGKGFMESISLSKTDIREFYAPDPVEMIKITRKTPSIVFNWEKFIEGFIHNLDDSNITLRLNSEVKKLIINDKERVKGVIFEDKEGKETKIFGKVVFGCDGFRSVIGKSLNIDYKEINFPIIKCLMKKGNYETDGFKYFFVPSGSLEYAQKFPPLIIFIFPRDEKNFETGIIIQTDNANQLGLTMPPSSEIMRVWVKLKDNYPLFSKMIKGSSIIYEKLTAIPMTGVIKNIIPKSGVVLLGDAAGFVEVSGGSGLVSSIKMAKIWSDLICNAIDNAEENL